MNVFSFSWLLYAIQMQLLKARITNFRSIEDSGDIDIDNLTSFIGKNEAGKTSVLLALRGINPHPSSPFKYDAIRDYPRRHFTDYEKRTNQADVSVVVVSTWELDDSDIGLIQSVFKDTTITVGKRLIVQTRIDNTNTFLLDIKETNSDINANRSSDELTTLCAKTLVDHLPKFFYSSFFNRLAGRISLPTVLKEIQENKIAPSNQLFLDFLKYAGTSLEELNKTERSDHLYARLEAAANKITEEIFTFWSQNTSLSITIGFEQGRPQDPVPFNSGTNAVLRIRNNDHAATVEFDERSAGLVWFFSFVCQYFLLHKSVGNVIMLLDEPGMTLHARAQYDLLRYFVERLVPRHQVLYTSHSPFLISLERMTDIRLVEDVVKVDEFGKRTVYGTRVSSDVMRVNSDTSFPLHAAFGMDLTQTLFIGKDSLLVEGKSDIVYLIEMSKRLKVLGREGIDDRWVLVPVGGIRKVQTFLSLFGANNLHVAVLIDSSRTDNTRQELLDRDLITEDHILMTGEFCSSLESDIEDLIAPDLFLKMLNKSLSLKGRHQITSQEMSMHRVPRIMKRAEHAIAQRSQAVKFTHTTVSNWLLENPEILETTGPAVDTTLDTFEALFNKLNSLL